MLEMWSDKIAFISLLYPQQTDTPLPTFHYILRLSFISFLCLIAILQDGCNIRPMRVDKKDGQEMMMMMMMSNKN
jgi:hypothetical protein